MDALDDELPEDECGRCGSADIEWTSGTPGVYIPLNGPVAARCRSCGAEATWEDGA